MRNSLGLTVGIVAGVDVLAPGEKAALPDKSHFLKATSGGGASGNLPGVSGSASGAKDKAREKA